MVLQAIPDMENTDFKIVNFCQIFGFGNGRVFLSGIRLFYIIYIHNLI